MIERYDAIFDDWVEETCRYADMHNFAKVMRDFDEYCGIKHAANSFDEVNDKNSYTFEVVNGPKFMLFALKYDLHSN